MEQGCIVIAPNLDILGSNKRVAERLNVPSEMVSVGKSFVKIIELAANRGDYGPGDPEEQVRERLASARSQKAHSFDRHQPDGTVLAVRAQPMQGGGTVLTYTDITELRRLENELRMTQESYQLAIAGSQSGIWDWDLQQNTMSLSPRYADILSIDPGAVGETPAWWRSQIHPDDIDQFDDGIQNHLAGRTDVYVAEYRVRNTDGDFRWIGDRGRALRDDNSDPYRMAGSVDDISDRKNAELKLRELALTDPLTGAANRRRFMELASKEIYRANRYQSPVAIALFDLDHFKAINDTYGHDIGDRCLCRFVELIGTTVRQSDLLARHGGEEFTLMLPQTGLDQATALCDRMREQVAGMPVDGVYTTSPTGGAITVSAGVVGHRPGDTIEMILKRADEALYKAKESGRNRVVAAA